MGSDRHYPEEAPAHLVRVDGFFIDRHPVTNRQFAAFAATGYRTIAECALDPADYPGAAPKMLTPGSMVFRKTRGPVNLQDMTSWWAWKPGASWRHPEGKGSSVAARLDYPVVQSRMKTRRPMRVGPAIPPDRGRMGICRPRQLGERRVRLG